MRRNPKAAEEAKKRQMAQLKELESATATFKTRVERLMACPAGVDAGAEEFMMVVEQAEMVIAAEEFSMAGDMLEFFAGYEDMLVMVEEMCPEGGAAPAPAEEAPSEEVPAEEAPAEEAPAEEAPAE